MCICVHVHVLMRKFVCMCIFEILIHVIFHIDKIAVLVCCVLSSQMHTFMLITFLSKTIKLSSLRDKC